MQYQNVKHGLASAKDTKPTIQTKELEKTFNKNLKGIDEIMLYYPGMRKVMLYKSSRNGSTFYCTTKFDNESLPKVGHPVWLKCAMLADIVDNHEFTKEFSHIRAWGLSRGIIENGNVKTQFLKLLEEVGELSQAIQKNDRAELIDAIGDIVVVLTNLAWIEQVKIENCINRAYDEIKDRKGKIIDNNFVKDAPKI